MLERTLSTDRGISWFGEGFWLALAGIWLVGSIFVL
jgi:hypothetical protein